MKKLFTVFIVLILFTSCMQSGYKLIENTKKNRLILDVYGYEWKILNDTVEAVLEDYSEYKIEKYYTYFIENRVSFIFIKK